MFKESNPHQSNEELEEAIRKYKVSEDSLKKAQEDYAASQSILEQSKMRREFLNRIHEKYEAHTKLITNLDNFNYMLKEVGRITKFYGQMLDNYNKEGFDFVAYEQELDTMVAEDLNKIETRKQAKREADADFERKLDDLFSPLLKK